MKKAISLLTALAMAASLAACAAEGGTEHVVQTWNEYEAYISDTAALESAHTAEEARQIRHEAYVARYRQPARMGPAALDAAGYSQASKDILHAMQANASYTPTGDELKRAGANVTLTLTRDRSWSDGSTCWMSFKWAFEWDSWPVIRSEDRVLITWGGDYNASLSGRYGRINYELMGGSTPMVEEIKPQVGYGAGRGIGWTFDTKPKIEDRDAFFARSGEGGFTLQCNDHGHKDVALSWVYEHTQIKALLLLRLFGKASVSRGYNVFEF